MVRQSICYNNFTETIILTIGGTHDGFNQIKPLYKLDPAP